MKWYIKDGVFCKKQVKDAKVFEAADDAAEIVIPDGVTSIGDLVFSWCTSLTSIGDRAFCDCYHLSMVRIPDTDISMGEDAFRECPMEELLLEDPRYVWQNWKWLT